MELTSFNPNHEFRLFTAILRYPVSQSLCDIFAYYNQVDLTWNNLIIFIYQQFYYTVTVNELWEIWITQVTSASQASQLGLGAWFNEMKEFERYGWYLGQDGSAYWEMTLHYGNRRIQCFSITILKENGAFPLGCLAVPSQTHGAYIGVTYFMFQVYFLYFAQYCTSACRHTHSTAL